MKNLLELQNKLAVLIRKYADLRSENERLLSIIEKKENLVKEQEKEINTLKKELTFSTISKISDEWDPDQKEMLKAQIDIVLKEIEKNISLLK